MQAKLVKSFAKLTCDIEKHYQYERQLQSELERVLSIEGSTTNSNILHFDLDQSFNVTDLSKALRQEIDKSRQVIVTSKSQIIEGRIKQSNLDRLLKTKIERLKERKAALFCIYHKSNRRQTSRPFLKAFSDHRHYQLNADTSSKYFQLWHLIVL